MKLSFLKIYLSVFTICNFLLYFWALPLVAVNYFMDQNGLLFSNCIQLLYPYKVYVVLHTKYYVSSHCLRNFFIEYICVPLSFLYFLMISQQMLIFQCQFIYLHLLTSERTIHFASLLEAKDCIQQWVTCIRGNQMLL